MRYKSGTEQSRNQLLPKIYVGMTCHIQSNFSFINNMERTITEIW